jgi:hypothetical protein
MDQLTSSLSSIGLLGYDLMGRSHFYRQLPFKTQRILSLNPRLKNAKKLVDNEEVQILRNEAGYVEANVKGTGVQHKVVMDHQGDRCTCEWFTAYQGKRGICKHMLAVKMLIQ